MTRITTTGSVRGVLIAAILAMLLGFSLIASAATTAPAAPQTGNSVLSALENAFTSVAEKVEPAVVFIETERNVKVNTNRDMFDDFFGWPFGRRNQDKQPQTRAQISKGSGVIVRADGYIMTNDHVVGGADKVTVTLSDKREFKGMVLRDPITDLALVKIDAKDLPFANLGNSDKVKPGQWAIAIGNPGGERFSRTLTVGVVSGITRDFEVPDSESPTGARTYPDAIQTDAAINPGNSGGPLLNIQGEVIGINSAIWSPSGGSVGIGFAVPSNRAKFVMDQLITTGKVIRGKLGVMVTDLTSDMNDYYGVKSGALVHSMEDDSAAKKAGVEVEDVIVELNGKKIESSVMLVRTAEQIKPETKSTLVVYRNKKPLKLNVTIGQSSSDDAVYSGKGKIGLSVTPLTKDLSEQLGVSPTVKGVVVEEVDSESAAEKMGIKAGDVIVKINSAPTPTIAEFNRLTKGLKSGDLAMLVVLRSTGEQTGTRVVPLRIE
ncbi:MAG: Do family serine endopeptidase [Armatimonadota bacterium]|nr:Do family serine endopeptidase [Armatimonadota bacterium]